MIKPCSIDNAIDYIRRETGQPYNYASLAALFIESSIDIYLPYCGNVFHIGYTQTDDTALGNILSFDYLTSCIKLHPDNEIATLINGEQPSISRRFIIIGSGRAYFFYGDNSIDPDNMPEDLDDLNHNYPKTPPYTITRQSLVVDMASIEGYLSKHKATTLTPSTHHLLAENESLKKEIDKLKTQLAKLETPEKSLNTKSAGSAAKIIGALADMNNLDLTQPHGQTNTAIQDRLDKLGSSLNKDTIGKWLKQAHEQLK